MSDLRDRRDTDRVYGPAEDSRLLGEAVEALVAENHRVLDVGTGSGYVATVAAEQGAAVVGCDRNPHACERARENGVGVIRCDLVSAFRDDRFDVVAFNPPYLPTDPERDPDDWMGRALSGGESGRDVVEPFLDTVDRVLAPDGVVLLLVSTLTDVEAVTAFAAERGFDVEEIAAEKHPFERLVVLALRQTDE